MIRTSMAGLLILTMAVGIPALIPEDPPADLFALTGIVRYNGPSNIGDVIDMSADAYCAGQQSTTQIRAPGIEVGPSGGLSNAIVYVKQGVPAASQPGNADPVVLDQHGCVYEPNVLAMQTNQPLVIRNSDATLHNVHVYSNINRGFNIGQPFQGIESRRQFSDAEIGIRVACDIHGWMHGSIAVLDHPFYVITGPDGAFTLDLPPGDYEIEAWHPELGPQTQTVTIRAGTTPQLVFEFQ